MSFFATQQGVLCAENVSLAAIAADVGSPCYVYSTAQLRKNVQDYAAPFKGLDFIIHYANKANPNQAVIATLAACGAGVDVTSGGELERALRAGIPPEKIVYSGVGKRREEIAAALTARIRQLNVESLPELYAISAVAAALNVTANVLFRVNPDVTVDTHKHLATGHKETKFGINADQLDEALNLAATLPNLCFKGFTIHLGTTIGDYAPFRLAFQKLAALVREVRARGVKVERLDLGGGVGIPYDGQHIPPFADYAALVHEIIAPLGCSISFEPGRRLVADAGVLVSKVVYVKPTATKKFLILDAGMNDLARPAMYGARHTIVPVKDAEGAERSKMTVVGPVCETGDLFGENYALPSMQPDDLVAILQAGAYGSAMAGTYNGRPLIPEVLVSGNDYVVVRRRITVAEQMEWETVPAWVKP